MAQVRAARTTERHTTVTLSQEARERQWEAEPSPRRRIESGKEVTLVTIGADGAGLTPDEPEVLNAHGLRSHELGEDKEVVLDPDLGEVRPKRGHLVGLLIEGHDGGGHQGVVEGPWQFFAVGQTEEALPAGSDESRDPSLYCCLGQRRPVALGHVPWLAQIRPERGSRCQHKCVARDAVGLDVVGMAILAEVVIRHHDLGAGAANRAHQMGGRLEQVGAPEALRMVVGGGSHHPRIAVAPGSAEVLVVAHAQQGKGFRELDASMGAQLVLFVRREMTKLGNQHLALLAQRAGDERDVSPLCRVLRHGDSGTDRLVIGMGMHRQQASISTRHAHDRRSVRRMLNDGAMTSPNPDSFPRQNARTQRFTLGRPRSFGVAPDGSIVLFVRSSSGTDRVGRLWRWTAEAGEAEVVDPHALLSGTDEELSAAERARRERSREAAGGIVGYSVDTDFSCVVFSLSGRLFAASPRGADTTREIEVPGPVVDPRIDPTGQRVAFVSGGRLYVVSLVDDAELAVSPEETSSDVTWGLADFIAAEELDRSRGFWWSPDGTQLLVQRTDESPVHTWFVSNPAQPETAPTAQRYPAAGTPNPVVSLWLIDIAGGVSEVRLPEGAEYLATVHWSDRGAPVIGVLDRRQQTAGWHSIDVAARTTHLLRTVTDGAWVDVVPGSGCWDHDGHLLTVEVRDDDYALCRDGERVSPVDLQVRAVSSVCATHTTVLASTDPGDQQVWLLTGASAELVSQETGWSAVAEGDTTRVVVSADLDRPLPTATITTDHQTHEVVSHADVPLVHPQVTLLPGDGDRPRVALLLPTGWSPDDGTLPVLMDPYGGPHHASVAHHQAAFRESQWFADQGFAVVVVDGRGTPGRPAWERVVRGDFAGPVLEDQVTGLHAVAHAFPELDLDRVAIRGWSFGGYLAALAVIDRPDVFHCAIAGAPVTDWLRYDTGYTERYLGVPGAGDGDADQAYRTSSLLERASGLARPIQLIHGFADDNVFMAHSLQLSQVLTAHGRPHEVLPLTGITHMATQEEVAENLLTLQVDFLRRSLRIGYD